MDERYPIGKFEATPYQQSLHTEWLIDIAQLPNMVEAALLNLDLWQLETPYRTGGWTVSQVVHHLVDSHTNCYARLKLALTEDNPIIRPYEEQQWVLLADANLPHNNATTFLHSLHQRLYVLFKSVTAEQWERTYQHPVSGQHTIWDLLGLYAWHGKHHVAHITELRKKMNWW